MTESGGEISCSVEETNRIRAELGLPPLEMDTNEVKVHTDGDEISMSVEETNELRKKLGLPPLEVGDADGETRDENGVIFVDMEKQEGRRKYARSWSEADKSASALRCRI